MSNEIIFTASSIHLGSSKKCYKAWGKQFLLSVLNNTEEKACLLVNDYEYFSEFHNNERLKIIDINDKYRFKSDYRNLVWMHTKLHAIKEAKNWFQSDYIIYLDVDEFPNEKWDKQIFLNYYAKRDFDVLLTRIARITGKEWMGSWKDVCGKFNKPMHSQYPIGQETNYCFRVNDKLEKFIDIWSEIESLTPTGHKTQRIGFPIALAMSESNMVALLSSWKTWKFYYDFFYLHNLGLLRGHNGRKIENPYPNAPVGWSGLAPWQYK